MLAGHILLTRNRQPHGRGPAVEFKPPRPTRSETSSLLGLEPTFAHALLACLSPCPPSKHYRSRISRSSSSNVSFSRAVAPKRHCAVIAPQPAPRWAHRPSDPASEGVARAHGVPQLLQRSLLCT